MFLFLDNEQLARSGVNCLENLVASNGKKFTPEIWNKTTQCIRLIFDSSVPHQLMTWKPENYVGPEPSSPSKQSPSPPQVFPIRCIHFRLFDTLHRGGYDSL